MLGESELNLIILGFFLALASAFGLGANDMANSFGTSIGSRVLSLRQACILATVFEITGAGILGGHIVGTIEGDIIDPVRFNGTKLGTLRLMQGQVSSLIGRIPEFQFFLMLYM